jgi:hypothetical protein
MGDIVDANSRCYFAAIIRRTQFRRKKVMEEVIIKPVGSQHILFSLQSFAVITCEGFVLISKFVMRIVEVQEGDLFLLDTTTFGTVNLPVQFSCLCSFKRGLLQCLSSIAC